MKNRIYVIIIFLLSIRISACSQNKEQANKITFPYSSEKEVNEIIFGYNDKGNFFPNDIDFDIAKFDKNYKYNISKKWDYYNYIYHLSRNIGYFKDSKFLYNISSVLKNDDYGQFVYQQWIKSFNEKDELIDSLQIVYYIAYTGIYQRMNSVISSPLKIEIEHHRLEWEPEIDDPDDLSNVKTIKGVFLIKDGNFIFQNSLKLGVFFNGYSYGDIYSNINKNCQKVIKSELFDVNNDGLNDAIYYIKTNKKADCEEFGSSDLIVCFADNHGLFRYENNSILDWDNKIFYLTNIRFNKNSVEMTIASKKSKRKYIIAGAFESKEFKILNIKTEDRNSKKIFENIKKESFVNVQEIISYYEKGKS